MASHHEAFKVLGPINWTEVPQDDLQPFLQPIFEGAQTIVDSIPLSASSPAASEVAVKLRKEWKEAKINPKENPLDIKVHKLAAKDGKGAWFARSSIHRGLTFDQWKMGLEREFAETMKVAGSPGSGNIRGIGADKRVEHQVVNEVGELQVFQLSAQFPGPTSPRDFITLLLTSDKSSWPGSDAAAEKTPMRQFMIISKPCLHTECPPRQGIIRGQYESVEMIREVPALDVDQGHLRSLSTADVGKTQHFQRRKSGGTAIEWLMVTRSDPGGSVPRFMIERGTPPGIVGDAGKFLKWVSSIPVEDELSPRKRENSEDAKTGDEKSDAYQHDDTKNTVYNTSHVRRVVSDNTMSQRAAVQQEESHDSTYSSALYSMITGALGTATSIAFGIRKQFSSSLEEEEEEEDEEGAKRQGNDGPYSDPDSSSDVSSLHSFESAIEMRQTTEQSQESLSVATPTIATSNSEESKSQASSPHEKELKKLQEKKRRLEEKMHRAQARLEQKRRGEKDKDETAVTKAREKHEKELAKQEAKYRKEMKRLEEKREHEIRKKEEKRRKALDKDEKATLSLELEKTRVERDVALQKVTLLEVQMKSLQAQNLDLAAKLTKLENGRDEKGKSTEEILHLTKES